MGAKAGVFALDNILTQNNTLTNVRAQGISMYPTLIEGDILLIKAEKSYKIGEIVVFYNTTKTTLIAHRIIDQSIEKYITKGDNAVSNEEIVSDDILGRVKYIWRNEKLFRLNELINGDVKQIVALSHEVLKEYNTLKSIKAVQRSISYNKLRLYLCENVYIPKSGYSVAMQYYEEFKCVAEACSNNCCRRGYIIYIDRASYDRYSNFCNQDERTEFMINTKLIPIEQATDNKYATINNRDQVCPFLSEKGLCTIQKKYGAELLCNVCRQYPRVVTERGACELKTLQMTCSAAAKLILAHTMPIAIIIKARKKDGENLDASIELRRLLIITCILEFRALPIYKRLSALVWLENKKWNGEENLEWSYLCSQNEMHASEVWKVGSYGEIRSVFEINDLATLIFSKLVRKAFGATKYISLVTNTMIKEAKKRVEEVWTYIIDDYDYCIVENYLVSQLISYYQMYGTDKKVHIRMLSLYLLVQAVMCAEFKSKEAVTLEKSIQLIGMITNDFVNRDIMREIEEIVERALK